MGNSPSSSEKKQNVDFPGSALLDGATGALCGADTTNDAMNTSSDSSPRKPLSLAGELLAQADVLCISSPINNNKDEDDNNIIPPDDDIRANDPNPTSALFARALVSEVTDNPRTMTPAAMAEREKRLLKAQEAARKQQQQQQKQKNSTTSANNKQNQHQGPKPVGALDKPNLLGSLAHALGTEVPPEPALPATKPSSAAGSSSVMPPNSISENRAAQQQSSTSNTTTTRSSKHSIVIGLSLSRRHANVGHPDTVTRQTAFDFNELQDRAYKYVSSTDASGWLAGGGEKGVTSADPPVVKEEGTQPHANNNKIASPDTVHIPIIQIDAESSTAIDAIIAALARGEVFIPHMAILPEALSVNGISPPDLVVRFGCERNDDTPPDEWPNWCLEFMHNQLYEYFGGMGAKWTQRPFQITLARKVRWKTVKHMNRYFSHSERVIDAWREKGQQYLDPQLSYIDGGATPEEVARPHGIYLFRNGNGMPTNYFAPNFDPPYTTKMTRSLLLNVLGKSWDKHRREWTSEPVARLVTPSMLVANFCGCADPAQGGFMASEVTSAAFAAAAAPTTTVMTPTTDVVDVSRDTSVEAATSPEAEETTVMTELSPEQPPSKKAAAAAAASPFVVDPVQELSQDLEDDLELDDTYGAAVAAPARPLPPSPERVQRLRKGRSREDDGATTPSELGASVATTAVHANSAMLMEFRQEAAQRQEQQMNGRSYHDENTSPREGDGQTPRSKGKKKKMSKEEIEKERARQIEIIAAAQEEKKIEAGPPKDKYSMQVPGVKKYMEAPEVQRTNSGTSLEYSIDSSMMSDSIFASDGSAPGSGRRPKKDDSALGPQSLVNGPDGVPTDEALFKVGWAKALDEKSGSYYYFTLDRSKIVWENPLSPRAKEAEDAPPPGTYVI